MSVTLAADNPIAGLAYLSGGHPPPAGVIQGVARGNFFTASAPIFLPISLPTSVELR